MKKLSFYGLTIAGMLFAACSADRDVAVVDGPQKGETPAEGYVSLSINLPTTSSSMRALNDDFNDGKSNEYDVSNIALLFFDEQESGEPKLICAKAITDFSNKLGDVDDDNITTSYKVVSQISGHNSEKDLYALAVLNYGDWLAISSEDVTDVKIKGKDGDVTVSHLSDFYTELEDKDLTGGGSKFFMTNAVLSTVAGETKGTPTADDVIQLAELDKNMIFRTPEEAEKRPAGEILVERAVAKVTLDFAETAKSIKIDGVTSAIEFDVMEWAIDNMEPTTYVARKPGDLSYIAYSSDAFNPGNNYRFVSHTSTIGNTSWGTEKDYYRTYWCVDPTYNDEAANFKAYNQNPNRALGAEFTTDKGDNNPQYCYENTFDVAHQSYQNTTRAVIRVKLKGGTFYTVNGDYYKTDYEAPVQSYVANNVDISTKIGSFLENGTFNKFADLAECINVSFEEELDEDNKFTISSITLDEAKAKAKALFVSDAPNFTFKEEATPEAIYTAVAAVVEEIDVDDLNNQFEILEYTDGVMYYEARFKHFASEDDDFDLAPWATGESWETPAPSSGLSVEKAYPNCNSSTTADKTTAEKRYLGRYGMVRNNWYDVEVTAFKKIGYPTFPDLDGENGPTPDDDLKDNIAVKIHVLAWAKRTQKWQF